MDQRERMKFLVFILVHEFAAKQIDVARVFSLSPATISLWMKEMRLRHQVHMLTQEVNELRQIASAYVQSGQIGTSRTYEFPSLPNPL